MQPCLATSEPRLDQITSPRAAANRANAQLSTGPRSVAGKRRASLNALTHGLTARTAVLPSEDPAAYENHLSQFHNEYQPATATETQLVRELADSAWRLNRIPLLEARLISGQDGLRILDAHRLLQSIGVQSNRLSRQFHNTLHQLRDIQADRRQREKRDVKQAAALLELHKRQGTQYDPTADGFVFSIAEIESLSRRLMRQNQARHYEYVLFEGDPRLVRAAGV
jgi:hypothetical protein